VRAEDGPLPPDTRINVRYGSNQEGEPYVLGQQTSGQAVFCDEAGAEGVADGAAGAMSGPGVYVLSCRLYTQGPARLDATATGYEPIDDEPLSLDKNDRCKVDFNVELERRRPDAGT
jgi:hypothetical protein